MGSNQNPSRSDTLHIKSLIYKQIGTQRAQSYFHNLGRFFTLKITKSELDKFCLKAFGKQNISLHNRLIRSLIKNSSVAKSPPLKKGRNFIRLSNGVKCRDRASPLGKPQSVTTTTSATELMMSLGSRPPLEVEEGEEVEQVAWRLSSVTAPLGVDMRLRRKAMLCSSESCQGSCELPDTRTLRKRLEMEGVKISMDSVSVLNSALDVFMRRLIEPCLSLANQTSSCVSMSDFRAAVELNPQVLGEEWSILMEKICLRGLEE